MVEVVDVQAQYSPVMWRVMCMRAHRQTQTDTDRHRQTQTDIDACVLDGKWGANTQKHLDVYVRVCLYMYVYLYLDPYL